MITRCGHYTMPMSVHDIRPLADADVSGKRVLVRVDHNIELNADGKLKNDEKIQATLPTIEHLLTAGAHIILMTHVGRPKGKADPKLSTVHVAKHLGTLLPKVTVMHITQTVGPEAQEAAKNLAEGSILYLENVRFHSGEEGSPDEQKALGKDMASLGEVFVNEAFASCHEYEEASTCAVARLLPSFGGLHLQREVSMLSSALHEPTHPVVLILSGAKMETKIPVIERFLTKGDHILLGGCIANTFIAARGFNIGKSKYEEEHLAKAQETVRESEKEGRATIHVPGDAIVAAEPKDGTDETCVPVQSISSQQGIFDIGTATVAKYREIIASAKTIVWNGPLGLYEVDRFSHASGHIADAIAQATKGSPGSPGATSIIGGGDTIDFHIRYKHPLDAYTFVSTGGGAMLEFIGGKELPAIEALRR